jgi:hypothetical protein
VTHPAAASIALVACPRAPAGAGDATRRWALAFPDGRHRFAGVTRPEGQAAAVELARMGAGEWERALVEVALPALLSDGAGPHLLDAGGRVTLALGSHPRVPGALVAMGEPAPGHRVGLVRRRGSTRVWTWLVAAVVAPPARVEALDALDRAADLNEAVGWQERLRREDAARSGQGSEPR